MTSPHLGSAEQMGNSLSSTDENGCDLENVGGSIISGLTLRCRRQSLQGASNIHSLPFFVSVSTGRHMSSVYGVTGLQYN